MLYYTKGYTNQLKLCPTTDDYPQADSPPQPAQGPRSSKRGRRLESKASKLSRQQNYLVPLLPFYSISTTLS